MMNEIKEQITQFLSLLQKSDICNFLDDSNRQDLVILKKQLEMFEFQIKDIAVIPDTDFYKICYGAKDTKQTKEQPSYWFALKCKGQQISVVSRFSYLKELAKQKQWRSITKENITFYFDYSTVKSTEANDIDAAIKNAKRILDLFELDLNKSFNYFVCDTKETLKALGFTHTASDSDNIISTIPNDTFEMIKMCTNCINEDASQFLRDGFALYYSKHIADGCDTFNFTSHDIEPMAEEIISHAPYANIKKCITNKSYEEITDTLFFFSMVHAGSDPEIDYELIILSPPASFMNFLMQENTLIDIEADIAHQHMIKLLKIKTYKEIKKEFKKLFEYSLGKYNRHWKKHLKGK